MFKITGVKLVVFDLDDTLYPELDFVRSGFAAVARWLSAGDEALKEAVLKRMYELFQLGRRDIFQSILREFVFPHHSREDLTVEGLLSIYRSSDRRLALFPDAKRLLERLSSAGKLLALLTDGLPDLQRRKVESLNIERYFGRIVYTWEYGNSAGKPSDFCFRLLEKEFGLSGRSCAYIADNEGKDFLGPNRLGWITVKVVRPSGIYKDVKCEDPGYKARFCIDSLEELDFE